MAGAISKDVYIYLYLYLAKMADTILKDLYLFLYLYLYLAKITDTNLKDSDQLSGRAEHFQLGMPNYQCLAEKNYSQKIRCLYDQISG